MVFLGITGEAYLYRRIGPISRPFLKEIWTFHPSRFEHVPGANGLIKGWIYRKGAKQIPFLPHEVFFPLLQPLR